MKHHKFIELFSATRIFCFHTMMVSLLLFPLVVSAGGGGGGGGGGDGVSVSSSATDFSASGFATADAAAAGQAAGRAAASSLGLDATIGVSHNPGPTGGYSVSGGVDIGGGEPGNVGNFNPNPGGLPISCVGTRPDLAVVSIGFTSDPAGNVMVPNRSLVPGNTYYPKVTISNIGCAGTNYVSSNFLNESSNGGSNGSFPLIVRRDLGNNGSYDTLDKASNIGPIGPNGVVVSMLPGFVATVGNHKIFAHVDINDGVNGCSGAWGCIREESETNNTYSTTYTGFSLATAKNCWVPPTSYVPSNCSTICGSYGGVQNSASPFKCISGEHDTHAPGAFDAGGAPANGIDFSFWFSAPYGPEAPNWGIGQTFEAFKDTYSCTTKKEFGGGATTVCSGGPSYFCYAPGQQTDWDTSDKIVGCNCLVPGTQSCTPNIPPGSTECTDNLDNDGDGLRDYDGDGGAPDPGCSSEADDDETNFSANIAAADCLIAEGDSSCRAALTWGVAGANDASSVRVQNVQSGVNLYQLNGVMFRGPVSEIPHGATRTFNLYADGAGPHDSAQASASCAPGLVFDAGSGCIKWESITGNTPPTIDVNPKVIRPGDEVTVTWTTGSDSGCTLLPPLTSDPYAVNSEDITITQPTSFTIECDTVSSQTPEIQIVPITIEI